MSSRSDRARLRVHQRSTRDFTEALAAIQGEKASGLSATNMERLKVGQEAHYKAWNQRHAVGRNRVRPGDSGTARQSLVRGDLVLLGR
jgi:hypothetical protein